MKRICNVALVAVLLAAFAACSTGLESAVAEREGPSRPASQAQSAPQASSVAEEPAGPVQPPEDEAVVDGPIASWKVEPTIEADDIRPFVDHISYRYLDMTSDGLAASRGLYYWQASAIELGGLVGVVDYSGKMLVEPAYPVQEAEFSRYTFRGIEFGMATDMDGGEARPALLVQAAGSGGMPQYYPLDESYQPAPLAVYESSNTPPWFYWVEDAKTVGYYPTHDSRIDPVEVSWNYPLPVLLAERTPEGSENPSPYEWGAAAGYGFANKDGVLVDFEYTMAQYVWENIAAVYDNGWYYVDMDGRRLNDEPFDEVDSEALFGYVYDFSEGLVAVCQNGKWGYMDANGTLAVPCVYDATRPVYNGMAWVQVDGKWGVANLSAFAKAPSAGLPGGPVVEAGAPSLAESADGPAGEPVQADAEDEGEAAAARDAGTAFANFYRSYIEAINEQDASLLAYCTEDCRAEMTTRIFDANNSTQTYEILEIAVDLQSISGTSVYTRTTTKAFNRKTGAFLDQLETVRLVQFTRDGDGNWLVDSVAVDYTYALSDSLHLL